MKFDLEDNVGDTNIVGTSNLILDELFNRNICLAEFRQQFFPGKRMRKPQKSFKI